MAPLTTQRSTRFESLDDFCAACLELCVAETLSHAPQQKALTRPIPPLAIAIHALRGAAFRGRLRRKATLPKEFGGDTKFTACLGLDRVLIGDYNSGKLALAAVLPSEPYFKFLRTVATVEQPWQMATFPDRLTVAVATRGGNAVHKVLTESNTTTKIDLGSPQCGCAVTPDGKTILAAGWGDGKFAVINAATGNVTQRYDNWPKPGYEITLMADGKSVAQVTDSTKKVFLTNWTNGAPIKVVSLMTDGYIRGIASMKPNNAIITSLYNRRELIEVDLASGTVLRTIDRGGRSADQSLDLSLRPDGGLFVAGEYSLEHWE